MDCFKKYDIRGVVDRELTEKVAYYVGHSLAIVKSAKTAVVGRDARESSPRLAQKLIEGLLQQGVRVYDIGQTGTEEVYFACQHLNTDLGIEVTASHNPIEYNGIKFVGKMAKPFSETEFLQVKQCTQGECFPPAAVKGTLEPFNHMPAYVAHLMSYIEAVAIKPLKIVVNAGNGVAGHVIDALEEAFAQNQVPIEFVKIFHTPDATFPNGIPNPLLEKDRYKTTEAVLQHKADLGIAWDGDFDRCFLFDENGEFIDGIYIVGLLAKSFLLDNPGATIVHDPRVFWNTKDIVSKYQGKLVKSLTGHAYIKAAMRDNDAIYGGEMSAHHYFKSFGYCDSGMIPWLLVTKLMSQSNNTLSQEVKAMRQYFPASGEINFVVDNVAEELVKVQRVFKEQATSCDTFDGLSMTFAGWRFNLRGSATEPLLRLNVESVQDEALIKQKVNEISSLIGNSGKNDAI